MLKECIRIVNDFPQTGISFYDITPLLQCPDAFQSVLAEMQTFVAALKPTKLVAIESRGFLFAPALADRLNLGLIPARKAGKLPHKTVSRSYALEYADDKIELHCDALEAGDRVVIIDDLLATGGTMLAVCQLVESLQAEVVGISTVIELSELPWREKLQAYKVQTLISYDK